VTAKTCARFLVIATRVIITAGSKANAVYFVNMATLMATLSRNSQRAASFRSIAIRKTYTHSAIARKDAVSLEFMAETYICAGRKQAKANAMLLAKPDKGSFLRIRYMTPRCRMP
jgi:hypothetical protein